MLRPVSTILEELKPEMSNVDSILRNSVVTVHEDIIFSHRYFSCCVEFGIQNISRLFGLLGDTFFMTPVHLHSQRHSSFKEAKFVSIPFHNSDLMFAYDIRQNHLKLSCKVEHDTTFTDFELGVEKYDAQLENLLDIFADDTVFEQDNDGHTSRWSVVFAERNEAYFAVE